MLRTLVAFAAIAAFGVTGALAESRSFPVTDFDKVSVGSGISAIIEAGPAWSVTADAPNAAIMDRVRVEVRDGRLEVSLRWTATDWVFNFGENKGVALHIAAPLLAGADANSGADVDVREMTGDHLTLSASSGASIAASGVAGAFVTLESSSGGHLRVDGSCDTLVANVSTGSVIDAARLVCKNVSANASVGGSADVTATASATADASVGASVTIHGHPATVNVSSSTGGSVGFAE